MSDGYDWSNLTKLQVGRYGEYYTKMEFTKHGYQVYSAEVDDRGIDFVVRKESGRFYEVQVKSVRNQGYIFCPKGKMLLTPERLVAVVVFTNGKEPSLFLIPSEAWRTPNELLVDRDYPNKRSKPEYGINLSGKNLRLLDERYSFSKTVDDLELRPDVRS